MYHDEEQCRDQIVENIEEKEREEEERTDSKLDLRYGNENQYGRTRPHISKLNMTIMSGAFIFLLLGCLFAGALLAWEHMHVGRSKQWFFISGCVSAFCQSQNA